jgi:hypothetical protein
VLGLDDEQFERYLKQFRPLAPEPLAIPPRRAATRRSFAATVWALSGASVLLAGLLIAHLQPKQVPRQSASYLPATGHQANPQSLTLGAANALLSQSNTVKAALDQVAFHSLFTPPPKGKQSALAALSQDINKL